MNAPMTRARTVSQIKVTRNPCGDGAGNVVLDWIDEAGARQREVYHGIFASEFNIDLATVTLLGEEVRRIYLVGRIRELRRLRSD